MIEGRLDFLGIDDSSHERAAAFWHLIAPKAPAIATRFYERVRQFGIIADLTDARIATLRQLQLDHWRLLFTSRLDADYVKRASLVGIKHREVGVDPDWYIVAYGFLKQAFSEALDAENLPADRRSALQRTLDQYIAIDMALALSAYTAWLID